MRKSLKIGLGIAGGLVALTGVATGTAFALQNNVSPIASDEVSIKSGSNGDILNSTLSKPSFSAQDIINANKENVVSSQENKEQQIATFSLTPELSSRSLESEVKSFTLTINNLDNSLGQLIFTDSEGLANKGTTLTNVTADTQIFVRAETVKEGYTLYDLDVSCEGNESYYLDTWEVGSGVYTFTLPPLTISGPEGTMPNPFYNGSEKINVNATFAEAAFNGWTYNFNLKSYMYQINEDDFVLDDSTDSFKMKDVSTSNIPVKYVLDLNGHDLGIKTFTIPEGCDLIIINTKDGTIPKIKNANKDNGTEANKFGHIRLGGCLTEYKKTFQWAQADYSNGTNITWTEYVEITSFWQLEHQASNNN